MNVGEKMTSIANKIRALRGVSGGMGIDAMENHLETALTELDNAYTAIGNKNGMVPSQKTIGNLASSIGTVSTGVTIQKSSGTFRTSSEGSAHVVCGFKPDLVYIHRNEKDANLGYLFSVAMAFGEEKRTGSVGSASSLALWTNSAVYDVYIDQDSVSFFVVIHQWIDDSDQRPVAHSTFSYTAVKYT